MTTFVALLFLFPSAYFLCVVYGDHRRPPIPARRLEPLPPAYTVLERPFDWRLDDPALGE